MGKQNQTGQDRKNTLPTIRDQFTFYRSFYEGINVLQREIRLDVYEAIMEYALNEKIPENLDGAQKTAFILIKPVLDSGRKKAIAGKLGGSKKKAKRKQTESKGEIEKENEVEIENEIEIETEKEKEKEKEGNLEFPNPREREFESFWQLYPRKEGKMKAKMAYIKSDVGLSVILGALGRQLSCEQWHQENGRFIPLPATWLNQRRWEDEPATVRPGRRPDAQEIAAVRRLMEDD